MLNNNRINFYRGYFFLGHTVQPAPGVPKAEIFALPDEIKIEKRKIFFIKLIQDGANEQHVNHVVSLLLRKQFQDTFPKCTSSWLYSLVFVIEMFGFDEMHENETL